MFSSYYKCNKPGNENQGQIFVSPMDVIHQASMQDRLFIQEIVKDISPEELKRFCLENGFELPQEK